MAAGSSPVDIEQMPRGGPGASWLDRRLETDRLEYLDRDDIDDRVKRRVIRSLERSGRWFRVTKKWSRLALEQVDGITEPKILELGSGHGALSRELLRQHPRAEVTASDIDPVSVADFAASDLGRHPRATVKLMDATAIDAPDGAYDLVVFAQSFHHLPPPLAAKAFAEGTRVGSKLLIIDLPRPRPLIHLLQLATFLPFSLVVPVAHDGFISSLRAYSPAAMRALAAHADPAITVWTPERGRGRQVVVASRAR